MRIMKKSEKVLLSLVLVMAILTSVVAGTLVVSAKNTDGIAPQGAENYYLWGQNSNDPDFGSMSSPTGSFSYDGTKGYYYYDLTGMSGGDYCFVVSKVNNSGATAVRTPALGGVASSGKYYLSQGNYHGYACMHLWNPAGEAIRIYFTSEGAGLNAVPLSEAPDPGPGPTTGPTPTTGPSPGGSGYVYCENAAGWGAVYAYMWNSDSDKNAAWPGVKMESIGNNIWRYAYSKSYANIIFNIGSDKTQTTDLVFPGDGYCYNNKTGAWSVYSGDTPVNPTSPVTPTNPPVSGGYVYCKDSAGWGTVYAYMWNSDSDKNAVWPGVKMEKVSGNIWRYAIPKDFSNIIFNIGSDRTQTTDLTFPGAGYMYDNASGSWSKYAPGGDDPTTPSTPNPTSPNPTTAPPSGDKVVYCNNEAGWSIVTVYMWNGAGSVNNGAWPGVSATKIGNNIWKYVMPRDFEKVIFSESGQNQSDDLAFPGSGYMYNNKTKEWSVYDTSKLQVQSFGTDLEAPQYAGVGITLSATATGEGTVYYKFSVGSTVLHDYSTQNTALWTPSAAGTYTLTYEFKDSKGNTNKRTASYKVTDGSSSSAPYIKIVTPANGNQIKRSAVCNVKVSAGGGNTGTKKLFYKFTLKDSGSNTVNVPYYTRNTNFSFTPTGLGKYTLTVTVQANDNTYVERSYVYNSVDNITTPTEPATAPPSTESSTTVAPTQSQPTSPPSGGTLLGDADDDKEVTILDATRIQRWLAELEGDNRINKTNADVDFDKEVTILDATRIQRFIAEIIKAFD